MFIIVTANDNTVTATWSLTHEPVSGHFSPKSLHHEQICVHESVHTVVDAILSPAVYFVAMFPIKAGLKYNIIN